MRHRGGLSRKGIDRISHVITAQKIFLYDFSYTPLDVIVIALVNFSTAAGYSHRASCQGAFTVARSCLLYTSISSIVSSVAINSHIRSFTNTNPCVTKGLSFSAKDVYKRQVHLSHHIHNRVP